MLIRTFQPGDEEILAHIYNAAAKDFPIFKPAAVMEVRRRTTAADFDPTMRFFAEIDGSPIGYCLFNPNGRVSYPWCLPGYEHHAEALFDRVLSEMKSRGFQSAFAAYRPDWPVVSDYLLQRGFQHVRDMINFIVDLVEMPTPMARPNNAIGPLRRDDVPRIFDLMPDVIAVDSAERLERHLFENPYFRPESVFTLRKPKDQSLVGVGILIADPAYANPKMIDPMMPCFRLGAFGTEERNTKRINGLFSFVCRKDANVNAVGLDMLGHAAYRLRQDDELESLAAQVASDAPTLRGFYARHFDQQGGFPVFEYKFPTG